MKGFPTDETEMLDQYIQQVVSLAPVRKDPDCRSRSFGSARFAANLWQAGREERAASSFGRRISTLFALLSSPVTPTTTSRVSFSVLRPASPQAFATLALHQRP